MKSTGTDDYYAEQIDLDDVEFIDRRFEIRGGNSEAFECMDAEVLNESGAGTGKSFCLMLKAWFCATTFPGARILFLRKNRSTLNVVLAEWESEILYHGHEAIHGTAHYTGRKFYRFSNGSEVWLGGLDNPDKLMSAKWDLIVLFEATDASLDDWEKIISRLRASNMPFSQAIADCNPKAKTHWLNQRAKQPLAIPDDEELRALMPDPRPGQTQMTRCRPRHEDNPSLHDGNTWTPHGVRYMSKLWGLTGHRRERLLHHRWVSAEGLIWERYDPQRHVVDLTLEYVDYKWHISCPALFGETMKPVWRFTMSGDKGWTNPGALQLHALDGDGRMFTVKEAYHTEREGEWWADILYDWHTTYGIEYGWFDPSEPEFIHKLNDRIGAPVGRDGHRIVRGANNAFMAGRNEVDERMKKRGDGLCQWYVSRTSLIHPPDPLLVEKLLPTRLEDELEGYMWKEQKPSEDRPRDEPEKKDDHACDALRYGCMGISTRDEDRSEPDEPPPNVWEQDHDDVFGSW